MPPLAIHHVTRFLLGDVSRFYDNSGMQHRFYYPIWYPEEDECNHFLARVLAFVSFIVFFSVFVGVSVYYRCVVQYSVAGGVAAPLVPLC